ncbi:MAG: hypothetical protein WB681_00535 [Candidatus Cybelea sp.]
MTKRARLANITAALAIAIVTASALWYATIIWNPGSYGDFGLTVGDFGLPADDGSWIVTSIVPTSPAERAGIKLGDRVAAALPVHDRLTLTGQIAPRPGERVRLRLFHGHEARILTIEARRLKPLRPIERVFRALQIAVSMIFALVGLVLVLLRPNKMTWGFYLLALPIAATILPHSTLYPVSYLPTTWLIALGIAEDVLTAAGAAGFFVFCLRFPSNAPMTWRKGIDDCVPLLVVALAALFLSIDLGRWFSIVPPGPTRFLWNAWLAGCVLILTGGATLLLTAYFDARGAERIRIKWVMLGLVCTATALAGIFLSWGGPLSGMPVVFVWVLCLFVAAFPLTVAYAVIRYRVIDVRFVISRSMAVGAVAAFVGLIVIAIDWLFTTKIPASRFETATYFGVAFLIGLTISALRRRIGRTIDFLFFREQLVVRERVEIVAAEIRRASVKEDLHEPLSTGVARAFGLASVALFERAIDGGFGRVAADGWPARTLWHMLLDDPSVSRAEARPSVTNIDSLQWHERRLPPGIARPVIMVPIIVGRRIAALLLCGAHVSGACLNPEEIRWIRALAADAALVYGASTTPSWDGGEFRRQFKRVLA